MKFLVYEAVYLAATTLLLSSGVVASFSPPALPPRPTPVTRHNTPLAIRGGGFLTQKLVSSLSKHKQQKSSSSFELSMARAGAPKEVSAPLAKKIMGGLASIPVFFVRQFRTMSRAQKFTALCFLTAGFFLGRMRPFWTRYTAVVDIPSAYFGPKAPILSGRAVTVSDGDTIRFLHTPTPLHAKELRKGERASKIALPIRVCTIDTPETAKFGKPGQPFGVEAKETLKSLLEDKDVKIRLLQADQYGRGVAQVFVGNAMNRQYVDEEMLKAGMAEVYQGGGAVYGPLGLDGYLELEAEAKKSKLGIWSKGKRESAAEYKKRTK